MPNISQEITSFFPVSETSAQTKRHRSRSEGESGSSPLLKRTDIEDAHTETATFAESTHDTSATVIKPPDSCEVSACIDYISNVMERVLHRLDKMDGTMMDTSTEINLKLDTIKKDYEERISAVESSFVSYRKETDEKLASLSSAFEHYKMETDQKIAIITASAQQTSDMYEEEKRMKEDLDMRVESLVESENHLLHMYRKTSEDLDALAQYGRRNCLLLHGVKEEEGEDTTAVFIKQAKDMGVLIKPLDIGRSHRLGRPRPGGKRPIIAKFVRYSDRARVYSDKKKCKGTGKMITESLTATRVARLRRAISRYESKNVWTMDGEIFVNIDGKKTRYIESTDSSDAYGGEF